MANHQPAPHSTSGRPSSPSLQQREEAATARERTLAGEVERLDSKRAAMLEQLEAFEAKRRGAHVDMEPIVLKESALDPVLAAIRIVREDALRQRAEAADMLVRRLATLQKDLAQAEQHVAEGNARIERARAEAQRAARSAPPRPVPSPMLMNADDATLGDTLASSLPRLARAAQVQLNGQGRSSARVNLVAAVDFHSEHNFFNGFSSDISAGGLFVTTCEHAPIGTHISLKFTIPGGIEIEAEGEVRWVREISAVQPELLAGVGVAFTNIAPESVRAIEAFVAERDPMFFPDA